MAQQSRDSAAENFQLMVTDITGEIFSFINREELLDKVAGITIIGLDFYGNFLNIFFKIFKKLYQPQNRRTD